MLPTEAFAEALAFLRLFDLGAVVVTNALCSALSLKAANGVPWEELPGARCFIREHLIEIFDTFKKDENGALLPSCVASLSHPNDPAITRFVAASSFPNCVFEHLVISRFPSEPFSDAIDRVED
ncbi:hypothetical protein AAVH_22246 [Aphelenchoides avenae]|nr:hypothetical protein AAVH_22246 [Aphelenchus avenae]